MVTGKKSGNLVAEITARTHQILSAVSQESGGEDEGPNPHELLEAALAACTIITVQMYALRKGIKLETVDAAVDVLSEGAESRIGIELHLQGEFTEEQKARIFEIAGHCPVHKLLESHITIEMQLK
jgi:putative redox protein